MHSNLVFKMNMPSRQRSMTMTQTKPLPVRTSPVLTQLQSTTQSNRSTFNMFGNIIKLVNSGKGCNSCGGAK